MADTTAARYVVGPGDKLTVIDQRSPDAENATSSIKKGLQFIERWKGSERNPRITPIFGPHANYTLNEDQLRATRQAAIDAGVPISIHMSESPFEVEYSKEHYGTTSIAFFDSIGFLDGPTIGAHVVWPTEEEIGILAERRVGVIHNPTSNMKISSGIAPVAAMLAAGVPVGLGTDGAASNNDLDMWEEMRLAAFLQKVDRMDPTVLSASTVLNMATRGGAEAIGLGDQIGTLKVGMRADLIQVSFDDVHFIPTYDVISHLVYVADEQDVHVIGHEPGFDSLPILPGFAGEPDGADADPSMVDYVIPGNDDAIRAIKLYAAAAADAIIAGAASGSHVSSRDEFVEVEDSSEPETAETAPAAQEPVEEAVVEQAVEEPAAADDAADKA